MTRDGLVEQNRATGEERSVSRGERDFAARPKEPQSGTPHARAGPPSRAEKQNPAQHFRQPPAEPTPQAAVPSEDRTENGEAPAEQEEQKSGKMPARPHGAGRQYQFHDDADRHAGPPRLQFTRGEAPPGSESPKLSKLHRRAQKADAKLSSAREHLPTRRRLRLKHEVDEAGKARRRLRFAKEPKPRNASHPAASLMKSAAGAALREAGCTSPTDMTAVALALQGYNFGSGFISWAKERGGYSETNAAAFSRMEAAKLGWSSYGDVRYVPHVLRYYKTS